MHGLIARSKKGHRGRDAVTGVVQRQVGTCVCMPRAQTAEASMEERGMLLQSSINLLICSPLPHNTAACKINSIFVAGPRFYDSAL